VRARTRTRGERRWTDGGLFPRHHAAGGERSGVFLVRHDWRSACVASLGVEEGKISKRSIRMERIKRRVRGVSMMGGRKTHSFITVNETRSNNSS
jgi:hypothetical protein